MNYKNSEILDITSVLSKISKGNMSVRFRFKLIKNIKLTSEILDVYEASKRELLEKYCEKDENGNFKVNEDNNSFKIKEEEIINWNKDIVELLSIESKVDLDTISIGELEENNIDLSTEEMIKIYNLISE